MAYNNNKLYILDRVNGLVIIDINNGVNKIYPLIDIDYKDNAYSINVRDDTVFIGY